jgi:hypothetical protein
MSGIAITLRQTARRGTNTACASVSQAVYTPGVYSNLIAHDMDSISSHWPAKGEYDKEHISEIMMCLSFH